MTDLDDRAKRITDKWERIYKRADDQAKETTAQSRFSLASISGSTVAGTVFITSLDSQLFYSGGLLFTGLSAALAADYTYTKSRKVHEAIAKYAEDKEVNILSGIEEAGGVIPRYSDALKEVTKSPIKAVDRQYLLRSVALAFAIGATGLILSEDNDGDNNPPNRATATREEENLSTTNTKEITHPDPMSP